MQRPDPSKAELSRVPRWPGLLAIIVGVGILLGWALGLREVVSYLSGAASTKANTALCLVLTGAALLCRAPSSSRRAQAVGRALAATVCVLTVATLLEYLTGIDLSIDQLLFPDPWETLGPPGRMSVITAACLAALNAAIVSLDWETRAGRPSEWLALASLTAAFASLFGYFLGEPRVLLAPWVTTVAFPTATTLVALAIGVLLARPERGVAALVLDPGLGGFVARRIIPAATVTCVLLAAVDLWGERTGLWNAAFGRAAAAVGKVVVLGGVALWTAAALRREEAARQREQLRLRALLDVLPVGIVLCDKPGAEAIINPAAKTLFGGEPPGCTSSPVVRRADTGAPMLPNSWGLFATLADGRPRVAEELEVESVGGTRTILSYAAPVPGGGACGGFVDVTERKRAERELMVLKDGLEEQVRRRTADLAAMNRELETFAYSVSHDLRAPLRAADGFAAMLEELSPGFEPEQIGMIRRIRGAMQRMAALIDAMLALSRVGRTALHPAPLDLAAIAQDIAGELGALDPSRVVEWEIPERMPAVGDPTLVRAALENLLRNAWKFTRGRAPARITLVRTVLDGRTEYTVTDNGAGFDPAYTDRLFEPFARLHSAHEFEGTGVGLAIVRRVVERHGGSVHAAGALGKGASFTFTLAPEGGEGEDAARGHGVAEEQLTRPSV